VVGFSSLVPSRDAGAAPATAEVAAIYVDPDALRAGVGRALMQASLEAARARGDRALTLWVLDANHGARRFYERCGFVWDGSSSSSSAPATR
jgi:GNAT superfamily N-acetyltransferase